VPGPDGDGATRMTGSSAKAGCWINEDANPLPNYEGCGSLGSPYGRRLLADKDRDGLAAIVNRLEECLMSLRVVVTVNRH
jgi:hypothetical protein